MRFLLQALGSSQFNPVKLIRLAPHGVFRLTDILKGYRPKLGEAVTVAWKKDNGTACGGTEGFVLGVVGDEVSGEYLALDRSTYRDSFKSDILSLGILDVKVVPIQDVALIKKTDLRQRPPGSSEKPTIILDAVYQSNIDFEATLVKVRENRKDYTFTPIGNKNSETYGIGIKDIRTIKKASINISSRGTLQIMCLHKDLDDCIKWIQEVVELWPDHKGLVLFPRKVTYRIHDTHTEKAHATEEVIDRLAKASDGSPIIFPFGWVQRFFVESDTNPFQEVFPNSQPLRDFVLEDEKRRNTAIVCPDRSVETRSQQAVSFQFPQSDVSATRYLGAEAPMMRLKGRIESPKDGEDLMRVWLETRSGPWQWFNSEQIHCKVIVCDLTIDKKAGAYIVDFRKYSGNEF